MTGFTTNHFRVCVWKCVQKKVTPACHSLTLEHKQGCECEFSRMSSWERGALSLARPTENWTRGGLEQGQSPVCVGLSWLMWRYLERMGKVDVVIAHTATVTAALERAVMRMDVPELVSEVCVCACVCVCVSVLGTSPHILHEQAWRYRELKWQTGTHIQVRSD